MEKITLKLFEFYGLDAELNGVKNPETGEEIGKGLLQQKLPLVTKYWLVELAKKVEAEKKIIDELRQDLVKKFAKEDEKGNLSIPIYVDDLDEEGAPKKDVDKDGKSFNVQKLNPDYESFQMEFNTLLQTEKELEYHQLSLADFASLETSENYFTFFKLLAVESGK